MQAYLALARLIDRVCSVPRPGARRLRPTDPDGASFDELRDACRAAARALRARARAAADEAERAEARAMAKELEEVVVHHPLRDDLVRAWAAFRARWPDVAGDARP